MTNTPAPSDDPRPFAFVFRDWKRRMGMTETEAAKALGVSRRALQYWIVGRKAQAETSVRMAMTHLEGRDA